MGGYIGATAVGLTTTAADVQGDITSTDTTPELILKNTSEEDTEGGREGKITFKGEQSGGEESTLAQIESAHDGTSDDQKGDLIFKTNDGSDGASPTEAMRIDSAQNVGIGTSSPEYKIHTQGHIGISDDDDTARYRFIVDDSGTDARFRIRREKANNSASASNDLSIVQGNVGIGTAAPDTKLHVEGNLLVDAYNNDGVDGGIFFREGFLTTAQPSVTLWDMSNSGASADGLSLNANDGIRFMNGGSERMRIDDSGNLLLGVTTSPSNSGAVFEGGANPILNIGGTSTSNTGRMRFRNPNGIVGSITTSGSSTAYNTSSDYRLKENVTDVTDGITRVKQLAPKRFNFIADADTTVDGFLAHEAQTVVPEAVTGTHNEVDDDNNPVYQGIDQSKLVPLLTAALQEAITKIETLETQNTTQATQIADLITRVEALEGA